MKNKKAQLKIQQMAFMLIAVTLFFVLVGLMILTIYMGGLKDTANILEEEKAIQLISKLANSPEFSCGDVFSRTTNCIDMDKAVAIKGVKDYNDFWEVNGLTIKRIYPQETGNKECTLANYPGCDKLTIVEKSGSFIEYSNFVSLCRKELDVNQEKYDKCELGIILVSPKEKG
ncbi:MAG: hypothetical protein AABX30_00905 [Nanoarchaeota archaeon]